MAKVPNFWFDLRNPRFIAARLRRRPLMEVPLEEIARHVPQAPVVLEAGACDGVDTVRFARRWPDGIIHAFEPVPDSFAVVAGRVRNYPNVHAYELALSDAVGTVQIHVSEDETGAPRPDSSSLLTPTKHLEQWPSIKFRESVSVKATTLDRWAGDHGVGHIDLMWLDLQGMELRVLAASPALLARTSAVYMEVWRQPMYEGTPVYREVVVWMRDHGFRPEVDRVHRVSGNILFRRLTRS